MRPYHHSSQTDAAGLGRLAPALASVSTLAACKLGARLVRSAFLLSTLGHPRQLLGPRLRILVSDELPDWRTAIERAFRYSRHEVVFERLSDADLGHFDLVVPLTIAELAFLNEHRALIADNPIPIPSLECIRLCDDKPCLNRELMDRGFGSAIPRMGSPLPYPYIVKKRVDEWSQNSHVVLGPREEQELAALSAQPDYFAQEFVVGRLEYATHILADRRGIARSLTIKYAFDTTTPIKGRNAFLYRTIARCPHLDLFTAMLRSIGFEGICCINYKERDGHPLILEINPRVGGSLCPYLPHFVVAGRAR